MLLYCLKCSKNAESKNPINYYHKELHLGCCSSPRSASEYLYDRMLSTTMTQLRIQLWKVWFRCLTL